MTVDLVANATDDNEVANYTWRVVDQGQPRYLYGNNQSYLFDEAGEATVFLTVRDHWHNTVRGNFTVFISDTDVPFIDGIFDMVYPQGTLIEFNSSMCSDNVGIHRVTWSFTYDGELVSLNGSIVSHLFDIPGEYRVELNLSDLAGNWNSRTFILEVLDIYSPIARVGPDLEIDQGTILWISGENSTDNVAIVSYRWLMTSDTTPDHRQEEMVFTYEFTISGDYYISLTVYDARGNSDKAGLVVTVLDTEPPVANPGDAITVVPGTTVFFNSVNSSDNVGIVSYKWSFLYDDKSSEIELPYFSFIFWTEGRYVVTLTVMDARDNVGFAERMVIVIDNIPPIANAGKDRTIDQHMLVTFDGRGSTDNVAIIAWKWTLEYEDELRTMEGEETNFTFHEAGVYSVNLTVTDFSGNTDVETIRVTVRDITPPVADAGSNRTVDQSAPIEMDGGNSIDNVLITSYTWTFEYGGKQESLSGRTAEFTFDIPGNYTITLRVEDKVGLFSEESVWLNVLDTEPPVAQITMEPIARITFVGTTYAFDGSNSTDNVAIVEWTWTVSNGTNESTTHEHSLRYTFNNEGVYSIKLEVEDARGQASVNEVIILVEIEEVVVPPGSDPEPSTNYLAIAMIGLVIAVVAIALTFWRKGRS